MEQRAMVCKLTSEKICLVANIPTSLMCGVHTILQNHTESETIKGTLNSGENIGVFVQD